MNIFSVEIDQPQSNSLFSEGYISDQDRIRKIFRCLALILFLVLFLLIFFLVRFGIKGSGLTYEAKHNWANWTRFAPPWALTLDFHVKAVLGQFLPPGYFLPSLPPASPGQ